MAPDVAIPESTPQDAAVAKRRARRGTLITLVVLGALVAVVILLTPVSDDSTDTRLTTRSYGSGNARLAADLARRLGWTVRTVDTALTAPLDTSTTYLIFSGPTPMPTAERVAVLNAVRHGAGLLVAPGSDGEFELLDSLGLRPARPGTVEVTPLGDCAAETDPLAALRVRTRMQTFSTKPDTNSSARGQVPFPSRSITLLSSEVSVSSIGGDAESDSTAVDTTQSAKTSNAPAKHQSQPTIVAFPLGSGRVVALADPDVLRTDQMRNCAQGSALSVVRSLEYLTRGRPRTLVFAEYYQLKSSDSASVVMWEWLRLSGLGRGVLTLFAAGLVLLAARGRRTLAPVYRVREERRSALEHVDALATAWRAVRGTRTVARMLVRGIRRRHAAGRWRTLDDMTFLAALAERHPAIADDAALLTGAIESPAAPSDLPALRTAAAHIDAECLTP